MSPMIDKFKQMTFNGLQGEDQSRQGPFTISLTIDKIFIYAIIALIVIVLIFSLGVEQGKKVAAQKFEHSLMQMANTVNPPASQGSVPEGQGSTPVTAAVPAPLPAEKTVAPVVVQPLVEGTTSEKAMLPQKVPMTATMPPAGVQKELKKEVKSEVKPVVKTLAGSKSTVAAKEPVAQNVTPGLKKGPFYFIQVMSYSNEQEAQKLAKALKGEGFSAYVNLRGKFHAVVVGNFSQRTEAEKALASLKKKYKDSFIRRKES